MAKRFESLPRPARKLADNLYNDFFLQFRYAQGYPFLTKKFFELLRAHQTAGIYGSLQQHLPVVLPELEQEALAVVTPRYHAGMSKAEQSNDAQINWETYKTLLTSKGAMPVDGSQYNKMLRGATDDMIVRDHYFQSHRRGNMPAPELHASFFRRYVLQGADPESPAFNEIFRRMPQQCSDLIVQTSLRQLHRAWQPNHRGQTFYDQAAQEHIRATQPQAVAESLGVLIGGESH
jgi:hypothetical protein